jgi:hypothetical protein
MDDSSNLVAKEGENIVTYVRLSSDIVIIYLEDRVNKIYLLPYPSLRSQCSKDSLIIVVQIS